MTLNTNTIEHIDVRIIRFLQKVSMPVARIALFIVFFWFGILKLFFISPANPLVEKLLTATLPFMTFNTFIVVLGVYEMLIAIVFITPKLERLAILLLIPHVFVTTAPLILLPGIAWQTYFVPTLEGQYIIKNVMIVALAIVIAAHLHPMHLRKN